MPNKIIRAVSALLQGLRLVPSSLSDRAQLLDALSQIGREGLDDWSCLQRLLVGPNEQVSLEKCVERMRFLAKEPIALTIRELPIDGAWLMQEFGLKPSKQVGELLSLCLKEMWREPAYEGVVGCREIVRRHLAK